MTAPAKTTDAPDRVEEITTLFDAVTAPAKFAPPELVMVKVPMFVPMAPTTLISPFVPAFNVRLRVELAPATVLANEIFAPAALPEVVSRLTLAPSVVASP